MGIRDWSETRDARRETREHGASESSATKASRWNSNGVLGNTAGLAKIPSRWNSKKWGNSG